MVSEIGDEPLSHLEQHEADLDVLAEIAELVSNQSGPQQLLSSVLAVLERKLGMLRGTVMLLLPDGKELRVEAAQDGPTATVTGARYRAGEGVVGLVVQTAQPAVIPRVSEEPRFQNRIHNRPPKDCAEVSFLCVPIRLEGEVIGTLSVDLPAQSPELLSERVRVLEIVAGMIAYDVRSRRARRRAANPWRRRTSACATRFRSSSGPRTSSATRTACERSTCRSGKSRPAIPRL